MVGKVSNALEGGAEGSKQGALPGHTGTGGPVSNAIEGPGARADLAALLGGGGRGRGGGVSNALEGRAGGPGQGKSGQKGKSLTR